MPSPSVPVTAPRPAAATATITTPTATTDAIGTRQGVCLRGRHRRRCEHGLGPDVRQCGRAPGPPARHGEIVGVTAVPARDRLAGPRPSHHGEGDLTHRDRHDGEARHAERRARPRRPGRRQEQGQGGAEQVRTAVAEIDPRRRAVVDQEPRQRRGHSHGEVAAAAVQEHARTPRSPPQQIRPPGHRARRGSSRRSSAPRRRQPPEHRRRRHRLWWGRRRPRPLRRRPARARRAAAGTSRRSSRTPSTTAPARGTITIGCRRAAPMSAPRNTATPPRYGTATDCGLSGPGRSTTPARDATAMARGVQTAAATNAADATTTTRVTNRAWCREPTGSGPRSPSRPTGCPDASRRSVPG